MIILIMIIVTALLVCSDQLLKYWAIQNLAPSGISQSFIKFGKTEIINLYYTENRGAAFSIMSDRKWFTIGFALIAMVVFAVFMIRHYRNSKFVMIITSLVLSGGIGNIIDRISNGYVVDYLEIKLFSFPIFNFADILVTVGIMILLVYFLFIYDNKKEN